MPMRTSQVQQPPGRRDDDVHPAPEGVLPEAHADPAGYLSRLNSSSVSASARSWSRPVCFERMRVSKLAPAS